MDSQAGSLVREHVSTQHPPSWTLTRARIAPQTWRWGTELCDMPEAHRVFCKRVHQSPRTEWELSPVSVKPMGPSLSAPQQPTADWRWGARAESAPGPVRNGRWSVKHTAPPGGQAGSKTGPETSGVSPGLRPHNC